MKPMKLKSLVEADMFVDTKEQEQKVRDAFDKDIFPAINKKFKLNMNAKDFKMSNPRRNVVGKDFEYSKVRSLAPNSGFFGTIFPEVNSLVLFFNGGVDEEDGHIEGWFQMTARITYYSDVQNQNTSELEIVICEGDYDDSSSRKVNI